MRDNKVVRGPVIMYDEAFLIALLAATFIPLFILSFYTQPFADDFAYVAQTLQHGFWGAQKYWYYNWQGRYFSTALLSINPLVFNAGWAYKLNPLILMLLQLSGIYWLGKKLFPSFSTPSLLGLLSIIVCIHTMFLPDIGQQIFWQNTSYSCFVADILTFFLFASLLSYYIYGYRKKYAVSSCLFAIAIIGSYEINMLFIDMIVALLLFIRLIKKLNITFSLILFAVCIAFTLIDVTAPGNAQRASTYHTAHNLSFSIHQAYVYGKDALIHWMPLMLFSGLLLATFLFDRITNTKTIADVFSVPPVLSLLAIIAIPFMGMFLFFWSEGKYPPLRTVNGIYFYMGLGILYFTISCTQVIKKRFPNIYIPAYIKLPLYIIPLIILIAKPNNISSVCNDLYSGAASSFNKQMSERYDKLTHTPGDSCYVPPIIQIPANIPFSEIPQPQSSTPDPKFFNLIYNSFCYCHHKKFIAIKYASTP